MKSSTFSDIIPGSTLKVNQHFEEKFRLHLQGRNKIQARNKNGSACYLLHAGYFLGLFFGSENEDMFFRNVD
jgi:hypothetical protein